MNDDDVLARELRSFRRATESVAPPAGLVDDVMRFIDRQTAPSVWWYAAELGPRSLAFSGALAAAVVIAAVVHTMSWMEALGLAALGGL